MERNKPIIRPPNGLDAINAMFGKLTDYLITNPDGSMGIEPRFEREHIVLTKLPWAIPLSWNRNIEVVEFRCHTLLKEKIETIFQKILDDGLKDKIHSFGGCFQFRLKSSGRGYSTHSWGIAIDLNPETNRRGELGDIDKLIVKVFEDAGFAWGGGWNGRVRDPMHFQFCSGY